MQSRPPWPQAFLDALAADPRVIGAAELSGPGGRTVRIATTWDGREPLAAELPRLGALAAGGAPVSASHERTRWSALSADGRRVGVEVVRIGDLVPSAAGVGAIPLVDAKGLMDQWARWSAGRGERGDGRVGVGRGEALRLVPTVADGHAEAAYEAFLRVADAEGFLGDRMLFEAARARLGELSRRAPAFDEGFVVPTFDAVEVRWAFGAGVGGCKVPLVPAVHVGVGVTPADALEFWAAPAVRGASCTVACVADAGTRTVVLRTAGREALLGALLEAVDEAWEGLPGLLRAARRAGRTPAGDLDAVWKPLHLPRSFVGAARALLPREGPVTRLAAALALARAGGDAAPLVARKLGLAAGRFLAATPETGAQDLACPA